MAERLAVLRWRMAVISFTGCAVAGEDRLINAQSTVNDRSDGLVARLAEMDERISALVKERAELRAQAGPQTIEADPPRDPVQRRLEYLRAENEILTSILESCPLGVTVQTGTGRRLWVNKAQIKNFGASSKEELLAEPDEESYVDARDPDGRLPDEMIHHQVVRRKRVDGSDWWAALYSTPFQYQGRKRYLVWSADVTEQQQAVEDNLVRERMKGVVETAGLVSHEINQPLQSILGLVELLDEALVESRHRDKFNRIYQEFDRIRAILNQIQELTRTETGNRLGAGNAVARRPTPND